MSFKVVREQDPCLHVFAGLQQIRGCFQFDLIRFLFGVREGRIAACLQLGDVRRGDLAAVCVDHPERRRRGVLLVPVDIGAPLRVRVRACQINGRKARRLHDADGERRAVADLRSDGPIAVRLGSQRRNIQRICAGNVLAAQIARHHQITGLSRAREHGVQARKVCRSGQEEVVRAVHLNRRDLHIVHRRGHGRYVSR